MANARLGRTEHITGWTFIAPALVLLGIFMLYPILWSLWMSFQVGKGMNFNFGGFANIVRLTKDPVFIRALVNTLTFLVVQVPIMIGLALLAAVALNDPKLRFRGFFRTAIFLPCVTSLIAYSTLFKSMFATDGVVNNMLMAVWIIQEPIHWLQDPFWAKVLIIIAITWRWTGYNMVFYLAALQNVDRSIYEAARIDGASGWHQFWYITVPMLKPVILFTTIISTIGTLQLFDEVNNITQGGPSDSTLTLSLYIYNLTFKFMPSFGYSATVSWVIVLLVAVLSFAQFVIARDRSK
ncbi:MULTISPECIES: sugar ABC transporter permease [unclassified Devosia]|jgi:lactose/L-arabinose transport system permease protein|uniref:carbohydrate ABC transporter permease n=1 Tax=unclassified Devosia TaxID=196773 RepID=UPI000961E660|nr:MULTISPECIES: sugar ABC transporter permease [unclassified Devosia]MBN9363368.1 sugar ABC transporter permease [Devosia sp.]OJX25196.1 MAG: lactose ABC transporter permease [Devosia sp. 66-14]